jgi:D-alanyl-D-alanine carboxypeptidase
VIFFRPLARKPSLNWLALVAMFAIVSPRVVQAEALLLVEAESGKVLQAENATVPWHPASVTKLMTAYVTLKAVKEGRLSLDTLLTVSPAAAAQAPSKMGLRPGTQVTIDNALKMMLVKSANDMAVVLAEGVGGSIDGFSEQMNKAARELGMTQTNYVNPNGLPADGQVTSARDLAILARAIIRDVPEYEYFIHIPSIRFGRRVTQNFNRLIGRYPGADGFKTGFICASGYNLVASATRNGKRLIAVVLGASSGQMRAVRAIQLLERGFGSSTLSWLRPSLGSVENLVPVDAAPPDLHDQMCSGKRKRPASDDDDTVVATTPGEGETVTSFAAGPQPTMVKPSELLASAPAPSEPVPVYTGPTRTGAALIAAVAADSERQTTRRGKRSRVAAAKSDNAGSKTAGKHARSEAAPKGGEKAATAGDKAAGAPAKPMPAKPGAKPRSTEARPADQKTTAAAPRS